MRVSEYPLGSYGEEVVVDFRGKIWFRLCRSGL